jgi:hypothetical protein
MTDACRWVRSRRGLISSEARTGSPKFFDARLSVGIVRSIAAEQDRPLDLRGDGAHAFGEP